MLLGHFTALADGFRDFDGLPEANADLAALVARDNKGAETKAAATFDDLRGSVDENDFLGQFGAASAVG
jgi:hypothetical protein